MRASHLLRWSRALVLAGACLLTGSVAHTMADGLLPGVRSWVVLAVLATGACAVFLGRPASRFRVVVLTVGGSRLSTCICQRRQATLETLCTQRDRRSSFRP